MISASRSLCDSQEADTLPTAAVHCSLKRSIIPAKLPHHFACADPDGFFRRHSSDFLPNLSA
jgi:hypothetical protein